MRSKTIICGTLICISLDLATAEAQSSSEVASRMRPLGSPSAVDRYQQPQRVQMIGPLKQVAWMQSSDGSPMTMPSLPPSAANSGVPMPGYSLPSNMGSPAPAVSSAGPGFGVPGSGGLPAAPPTTIVTPIAPSSNSPLPAVPPASPVPRTNVVLPQPGGALPVNPNVGAAPLSTAPRSSAPLSSAPTTRVVPNPGPLAPAAPRTLTTNDYAPIAQPRLDGFATVDNCRNVTGPSNYRAAGFFNCDPRTSGGPTYTIPATYTPPPAQIAPVSTLPPAVAYPGAAPVSITGTLPPVLPGSAGYRPLFSFGQENNPVQVGQGLIGQPVAYVPGQTFRNVLRYLAP